MGGEGGTEAGLVVSGQSGKGTGGDLGSYPLSLGREGKDGREGSMLLPARGPLQEGCRGADAYMQSTALGMYI